MKEKSGRPERKRAARVDGAKAKKDRRLPGEGVKTGFRSTGRNAPDGFEPTVVRSGVETGWKGASPRDPQQLRDLLERFHDRYNVPEFFGEDPVAIPHGFSQREDIEIGGFLSATIGWGNRKGIVRSGRRMMQLMDDDPYDFVMNASDAELVPLEAFVHRTFNGEDMVAYVRALRKLYKEHGGIGAFFEREYAATGDLRVALSSFRKTFFTAEHPARTEKHLSSIDKGAACKRLCMYLKWMVRRDDRGVDFGLWAGIPASALYLPLDTHTASVGRALGFLHRRQNDWRAVEEITASLRAFDPGDPVRYDYSLFGAGIDGFLKGKE